MMAADRPGELQGLLQASANSTPPPPLAATLINVLFLEQLAVSSLSPPVITWYTLSCVDDSTGTTSRQPAAVNS